mgnify:CR=1 FL=1
MKRALVEYRMFRGIGIPREKSREIIKKAYTFEGYLNLYPIIIEDYIKLINKNNWTKEKIKLRLEEIFFD